MEQLDSFDYSNNLYSKAELSKKINPLISLSKSNQKTNIQKILSTHKTRFLILIP